MTYTGRKKMHQNQVAATAVLQFGKLFFLQQSKGVDKGGLKPPHFLILILSSNIAVHWGRISKYSQFATSQPPNSYKVVYTPRELISRFSGIIASLCCRNGKHNIPTNICIYPCACMGGMIGKSYVLISAEADKENPQEWRVVDSVTTNDSTKWNGRVKYLHKIGNVE